MFGWVVIGWEQTEKTQAKTFFVSSEQEKLQRFWKIEEVQAKQFWSDKEKRCDGHFIETTRKSPEGRFIGKPAFKNETKALGIHFNKLKK